VQHLFQSWESCVSGIGTASHVLLLADYDGTLTSIVSWPEEAVLSPAVRDKLRALAEKPAFSIGIISGRPLFETKNMVGIDGIYYAGNHGMEIEGPGLNFIHPVAKKAQKRMKELAQLFSARLSNIEGVIVEDKGLSLSIHYRLVKEDEERLVADIVNQITSPLVGGGKIRLTSGKKVWECRAPVDWDKGKAVETIRQEIKTLIKEEGIQTIYLGDDKTDEDAFRVLNSPEDLGIFIGGESSDSRADYFLDSTAEVEVFLSRLLELK